MSEMEVRLERLEALRVAHVHCLSDTPEDDAGGKIRRWAEKGLCEKNAGARLFGRDTFPTDKREPHGYEFFLTINDDVQADGDIDVKEIQGGLYAVLRFTSTYRANGIGDAWRKLGKWIEESEYKQVAKSRFKKEEFGWVNGYEEHVNWCEKVDEWVFDLGKVKRLGVHAIDMFGRGLQ